MPIPIDHLIHSRRRTIALIVQRDGSLTVRAPLRMPDEQILEFVRSHAGWIQKKQAQVKAVPSFPKKQFVNGESFLYLGNEYPLSLVAVQKQGLIFTNSQFRMKLSSPARARGFFIRWYKLQALKVFSERVAHYSHQNGFRFQKIRIASARTRWGSCSPIGSLSFTWRLVLAPLDVIDYVVVHELAHTQIPNHSKKFWTRVAEVMPDYKKRLGWLKKNGRFLTLDGE
jgi:predicted metal-dependent hydrolase